MAIDYARALKSRRQQTDLCAFFIGPSKVTTGSLCIRCRHSWADHFGRFYDPKKSKPPRGR